jgi:hypothetical protein
MSKKLIAVASAAALALSVLVAAPASATAAVTPVGGDDESGATAALATTINVPSDNVLRFDGASESVVRYDVTAPATDTAVRVVATGAIKLLTLAQYTTTANRKATFGAQALDLTSGEDVATVSFYAYTTSTAADTVTVTTGGNTIVRYLEGTNSAEYAYNLNFTAPTTADVSGVLTLTGNVTDVFGNKIEGMASPLGTSASSDVQVTTIGSAGALATGDDAWTESATEAGTYTFGVTTSATAGSGIVALSADVTRITGYSVPKSDVTFSFTTSSLADQVADLTKQVAALQVIVDRKVSKKKYNTLARKWNRANPNAKVTLKK